MKDCLVCGQDVYLYLDLLPVILFYDPFHRYDGLFFSNSCRFLQVMIQEQLILVDVYSCFKSTSNSLTRLEMSTIW